MERKFKSTHCKPQTATLTPFRVPTLAILHLLKFGFNPEKRLNV